MNSASPLEKYAAAFIALLEAAEASGVAPWRKTWAASGVQNLATGKAYSLSNELLLALTALVKGWHSPFWAGYGQAQDPSLRIDPDAYSGVRKGEKGTPVLSPAPIYRKDETGAVQLDSAGRPELAFLNFRLVYVFNFEQLVNVRAPLQVERDNREIPEAADLLSRWADRPATVYTGAMACYRPSADQVVMPPMAAFDGSDEFYSTLFHEYIHSTGHVRRLNRPEVALKPDGSGYAAEELVAELGAALLCNRAGITNLPMQQNSISYLLNWARQAKDGEIYRAASKAAKAAGYILAGGTQPDVFPEYDLSEATLEAVP